MTTEERDEMLTKLVDALSVQYDRHTLGERHARAGLLWFEVTEPERNRYQQERNALADARHERATAAEERTATALEGILQVLRGRP